MTPQGQAAVFFLQRGDRCHDLDSPLRRDQDTMLAAVSRLDADDRVGQEKVIRSVKSVKVDELSTAVQCRVRSIYFAEVGRIDHIILVFSVRI